MDEAERVTVRLRHYTRTSSKERILTAGRIVARDQYKVFVYKVFVERAGRSPLSARQVEMEYLLKRGKGNAYIESTPTLS